MFCPHCGAKLVENAKFCQDCGKKMEMPVQSSVKKEEPVKQPKPKKKALRWAVIGVIVLVLLKVLFSCGGDDGGKAKPVKAEPPILPNFILSDSSDRFWINSWGETSASFWAECHDGELCYIGDEYVNLLLEQGYTIVELEEDGGNIANKDWVLVHDDFSGTVKVKLTDWTYYGKEVWIDIEWSNDFSMAPLVSEGKSNKKAAELPNFLDHDGSRRFEFQDGYGNLIFTAPGEEGELDYVAEEYVALLVEKGYEVVFDDLDTAHWWVLKHPEISGVVRIKSLDLGDVIGSYEVEICMTEDITMDGLKSSQSNVNSNSSNEDFFDRDHDYEKPDHSKLDCLTCGGDGDCNKCGGDGEVQYYGQESEWSKCPTCRGSGDCTRCGGSGKRE